MTVKCEVDDCRWKNSKGCCNREGVTIVMDDGLPVCDGFELEDDDEKR